MREKGRPKSEHRSRVKGRGYGKPPHKRRTRSDKGVARASAPAQRAGGRRTWWPGFRVRRDG